MIAKALFSIGMILYVAPLFGLAFTIKRMLSTFREITLEGQGDAATISKGIMYSLEPLELGMALLFPGVVLLFVSHIQRFKKEDLSTEEISDSSFVSTSILCALLGFLGAHRFYVRKNGTGVFYLLTLGGLIFGKFIDYVQICRGKFTDAEGKVIKYQSQQNGGHNSGSSAASIVTP